MFVLYFVSKGDYGSEVFGWVEVDRNDHVYEDFVSWNIDWRPSESVWSIPGTLDLR